MMCSTKTCGLVIGVVLGLGAVVFAADGGVAKPESSYPFFAFDNGTGHGSVSPEDQAKTLKELGYAGIGYTGVQHIPEMLRALDAHALKMFSIYVGASVAPGAQPYEPGLKAAIEQLKGRDALIWVYVSGGTPSSADSDDRAVTVIREIADMAEKSGLRVALYPHLGCYVARVDDAVRLAKKVDRKSVGASFNLCHFLKLDDEKNLEPRLKEAMPYLFAVSINGADGGQTNQMDWDRLIQPLDRGTFDVGRVVNLLHRLGYRGPIGLQCFSIPGAPQENLRRSMEAWRRVVTDASDCGFHDLDGQSVASDVDKFCDVVPPGKEVQVPIQTEQRFEFQIPERSQKNKVVLELDARVQRSGVGGYSPAAKFTLNGTVIDGARLVNKPLLFKTAVGGLVSWYGDGENAWRLYYAENFRIIDADASSNVHRPIGVSGSHFAFDISDIVKETNVLSIRNMYDKNVQQAVNAEVPVVVANVTVTYPETVRKPEQTVTPYSYPMPSFVVPRQEWNVGYDVRIDHKGGIIIALGDRSFPISTWLSYPSGGWNGFSNRGERTAELDWRVTVADTENGFRIEGEGKYYKVTRRVCRRDDRIDVSDTILNKNKSEDVGIIIRNQIDFSENKVESLFWGGGEMFLREGSVAGSPENPTFYLTTAGGGIGLAAVDDVFRIHHRPFVEEKAGGLEDDKFALPPSGEYAMEWSIYPTDDRNYFAFINAVRRDWDLNSLRAQGCMDVLAWGLRADKFPSIASLLPETSESRWPENRFILISPPCVYPKDGSCIVQYGYPMLQLSKDTVERYKQLIRGIKAELGPNKKILGYYGPPTFSVGEESESRFKECRITLPSGEQAYGEGGTVYPLLFPTETNEFGKMIAKIVDQWLEWGVDGIYFDYFDPSTCGTFYTYNTWDGHTAEIDPATKTIKRKCASVDLLSCKYLASLVKSIERRGGVIIANRGMTTKTMTEATRNVPRLGEAGAMSQLLRVQLTPCPAGYQRTHLHDMQSQILGALDYGILSYPYDQTYSFPDNPLVKMYPTRVKELHQGYVIGDNKIITKRSGVFGWGDKSKITCFLYDEKGHPLAQECPIIVRDGNTFVSVNLTEGQLAILEKDL